MMLPSPSGRSLTAFAITDDSVAAIMASLIHVENVENNSHHDLSSWCNKYTDAIGIAQC